MKSKLNRLLLTSTGSHQVKRNRIEGGVPETYSERRMARREEKVEEKKASKKGKGILYWESKKTYRRFL